MPSTNEEALVALESLVKEQGTDDFWARISVKRGMGAMSIGMVEEATLMHIARPETWLPAWAGGGNFVLTVGHASTKTHAKAILSYVFKGPERDLNDSVFDDPDWQGPKILVGRRGPSGVVFAERKEAVSAIPGISAIPASQSSGDVHRALELERMRNRLEQMERDAARDRQEMKDILQRAVTREPPKPFFDPQMLVAVVPVVTAYLQTSAQGRAEREKLAQEQQSSMMKLITTVATSQKVDPASERMFSVIEKTMTEQRKIMEQLADRAEPDQSETFDKMTSAMTQMINVAMKATNMVAEARLESGGGGGESPMLLGFRELTQAAQAFFAARAAQANPARPPKQRRLPPQQPQQAMQQPQNQPPQQAQPLPKVEVTNAASSVDQIVAAIKAKRPTTEVAQVFVRLTAQGDPALVSAIEEAGSVNELFAQRLGPWAFQPNNLGYARELLAEVQKIGFESGVFSPQPADEEQSEGEMDASGDGPEEEEDEDEMVASEPANGASAQVAQTPAIAPTASA